MKRLNTIVFNKALIGVYTPALKKYLRESSVIIRLFEGWDDEKKMISWLMEGKRP